MQIEDYEPCHSIVVTPSKMLKYYQDVKLPSEPYPWNGVFSMFSILTYDRRLHANTLQSSLTTILQTSRDCTERSNANITLYKNATTKGQKSLV